MATNSKVYRARKNGVSNDGYIQYPEALEKLRSIFSKMKSKNGTPLTNQTITNYTNKINKISIMMLGHGYNGDNKFLLKPDPIIQKLNESGLKSQKDYLSPIVKLLQYLGGNDKQIKEMNTNMISYKEEEDTKRKDNKATTKEKQNAIPLDEIKKKLEKYSYGSNGNIDKTKLINKLLVSLYFDNELIARNNYYNMKIASITKKNKDFNRNYNYLILDRNKKPVSFIMLNYKTANTYGMQKFPIKSNQLINVISDYMNAFNKQPGDLLFADKNNNEFRPTTFIDMIINAMNDVLGKPINIGLIRKIHITEFIKSGLKSENEKEEFAKRLLHSVSKQKEYVKVNLFKEDRETRDEETDSDD
jgi:hypothetical protein